MLDSKELTQRFEERLMIRNIDINTIDAKVKLILTSLVEEISESVNRELEIVYQRTRHTMNSNL